MNLILPGSNNYYETIKMSLTDFLSMGGYAKYIWPVYGICAVVLFLNIALPIFRERKVIRELQKRLQSEESKT